MKKDVNGITNIKNGCIDYYYSLKIETSLRLCDLCESIQSKINSTIYNYDLEIASILEKNSKKYIKEKGIKELNVRIDCNQKQHENMILNPELDSIAQKIVNIEIDTTQKGIKIIPISEAQEQIKETEKEIENNYNFNLRIYGESFVNNYRVFVLPPYKIQLINENYVFIKAVLYIFNNGMMILRITVPIENLEMLPLFENNEDKYIKKIIDVYNLGNDINDNTIEVIKKSYYQYIFDSSKKNTNIIVISKVLKNIILADFDGVPQNIKDIPENVKVDLYKAIVAPIQKRENISFENRANEYIENNSCTYDGIKYITSSMGKCISVIDKNTIDYIENKMDLKRREETYKLAISSARVNLEFTFMIILLKNMNSALTYFEKEMKFNNIDKIQKEYNYNSIFILQLQQSCFGSVREQLAFFESKMIYFLDIKSSKERMDAIDSIIGSEKTRKELNFEKFLSIGGFLLTVIFGLPAIHETLTILRKSNLFIKRDIPIVTIDNCSIAIWIILIIILIFIVFVKNINVKNLMLKGIYRLKIFFIKKIKKLNNY